MSKFYEKVAYRDTEEDIQSQKSVDKWIFGLLLIVIGFVPLIVMASVVEVQSPMITNVSALTGGTKGDLFTHYKALAVLVITILAGIMFLAKILFMNGEIRKTKLNYAIGAFAVAIVLSTIISPNISIALHGQYNRTDGAISWLCYLALFFIAMNIDYPKKVLNYVLYSLYPFVVINLFIITMNFYGNDLLQKAAIKKIVIAFLPAGANIGEDSILVGTLNQWNYMSGMFAIMTVMFLTAAILEKNIGQGIGHLIVALMSVAVVLMSISTSGFLIVFLMMIVIFFVAFKAEKRKRSFAIIAVFLIASVPVFHILASHNARVWHETFELITKTNPYNESSIDAGNFEYNFVSGFISKAYANEKLFELPNLPEASMSAGSGRVYIWSKTIDLFKERPIFGYGLDTFMYNFPHYNIDSRAGLQSEHIITDKPHSIYISWLYSAGIFGFISIMAIVIIIIFKAMNLAIKGNLSSIWIFSIAWVAYLMQGLFNDSIPGITAPMWVVAGILVAQTLKYKEQIYGRNS